MKAILISLSLLLSCSTMSAQDNFDDKKGEDLINRFMQALLTDNIDSAANAILPMVHMSLKNSTGDALDRDTRRYQFKKAFENARFYAVPVKITRKASNNITAIGYGKTAEKGRERKYWISKMEGAGGVPAPLVVFFPEDGSDPSISYMGSL